MTEQEINEKLAKWLDWELHYHDWDNMREFPYYIPSGKPWRTHQIDSRPLPRFARFLDAQKPLWDKASKDYTLSLYSYDGKWAFVIWQPEPDEKPIFVAEDPDPAMASALAFCKLIDSEGK